MKKFLEYIVFPFLLITASVVIAAGIFLLLLKLGANPFSILSAEKKLFSDTIATTKYVLPRIALVHVIALYALAAYGLWALFQKYLLHRIAAAGRRLIALAKTEEKIYGNLIFLFFIVLLLDTVLFFREHQLRTLGHSPGSSMSAYNFAEEKPLISWEIIADERGMQYYNSDSFPRPSDPAFIINKQGYACPFDYTRATVDSLSGTGPKRKKKKLYIGDSLLQGMGASRHDKCFIEIFRRNNPGLVVCPVAVGGNDPVEYRMIAEKFIPELMPDEVNVMFCSYNIMLQDRKPIPYLPLLTHIHNVGYIHNYLLPGMSEAGSIGLQPDSAYRVYRSRFSLMDKSDVWSVLCRQSVIASQLYFKIKPVNSYPYSVVPDSTINYKHLQRIKDLADSANAKFNIIFLPTPLMKDYTLKDYEEHFRWVFGDLWKYVRFCPQGLITAEDCCSPVDFHYSDKGHIKLADYLQRELETP